MVEQTKVTVGSRVSGDLSKEAEHAMPSNAKKPPPVYRTTEELNLPHIVRDDADYVAVRLCND